MITTARGVQGWPDDERLARGPTRQSNFLETTWWLKELAMESIWFYAST